MELETVIVHTDGSADQTKKLGGWAFCLTKEANQKPLHEACGQVTGSHNTAELTALVNAMHYIYGNLPLCKKIIAYTDSKYVSDPFYFDSINIWESRGWKTNAGSDVANIAVWKEAHALLKQFRRRGIQLEVRWVKGHNGNVNNERMDRMAGNARKTGTKNTLYG